MDLNYEVTVMEKNDYISFYALHLNLSFQMFKIIVSQILTPHNFSTQPQEMIPPE